MTQAEKQNQRVQKRAEEFSTQKLMEEAWQCAAAVYSMKTSEAGPLPDPQDRLSIIDEQMQGFSHIFVNMVKYFYVQRFRVRSPEAEPTRP